MPPKKSSTASAVACKGTKNRVTKPKPKSKSKATKSNQAPAKSKNKDEEIDPVKFRNDVNKMLFSEFIEFWTPADWKRENEGEEETEEKEELRMGMSRVVLMPKRKRTDDPTRVARITERGFKILSTIYAGIDGRIPDLNGITHIYEDYGAYGMMEMLEMQIADYAKELTRRSPSVYTLFPIAEALAFVCQYDEDMELWFGVGDGDRAEELVRVIGALFLHCIRRLGAEKDNMGESMRAMVGPWPGLLDPPEKGGAIKNLGLVVGNMMNLADRWGNITGYEADVLGWKKEILKIVREKGLRVVTIWKEYEEYEDTIDEEEPWLEVAEGEGDPWDFAKLWKEYKKNNGPEVGISTRDLTKLTKAEKRRLEHYLDF
ncbi:hypothetical protein EDC01DRAFT_667948 [Geopyxis carbonaria]|nr:hypothetical protein EDC01DRAFT_667948 [Geopyxis carbonaria]